MMNLGTARDLVRELKSQGQSRTDLEAIFGRDAIARETTEIGHVVTGRNRSSCDICKLNPNRTCRPTCQEDDGSGIFSNCTEAGFRFEL